MPKGTTHPTTHPGHTTPRCPCRQKLAVHTRCMYKIFSPVQSLCYLLTALCTCKHSQQNYVHQGRSSCTLPYSVTQTKHRLRCFGCVLPPLVIPFHLCAVLFFLSSHCVPCACAPTDQCDDVAAACLAKLSAPHAHPMLQRLAQPGSCLTLW